MVAKLQARVAELEKFEASMRCPNCDNLRLEIGQLRRRVAELEAELVALPAADEGAVTVDGYADLRVFNDSPWNTLRGAANMLRVFMEGIDGDIPVTVTIRKAKP